MEFKPPQEYVSVCNVKLVHNIQLGLITKIISSVVLTSREQ